MITLDYLPFIESFDKTLSEKQKLLPRIAIQVDGCWLWLGSVHKDKQYGQLCINYQTAQAHRFIYELIFGKVQDDLVLDHLCRNRTCVNPQHLEPVTGRENTKRGLTTKLSDTELFELYTRAQQVNSLLAYSELADEFGVSKSYVRRVKRGTRSDRNGQTRIVIYDGNKATWDHTLSEE